MNDDIYNRELKALAKFNNGAGEVDPTGNFVSLDNPLCGDRVMLAVDVKGGRIESVIHSVKGCLLCQAAASAIGVMAPGMKAEAMVKVSHHMTAMLNGDEAYAPLSGWEVLAAFEPVKAHRNRHSCVLLPFQAIAMVLNRNMSERF